MKDQLISLVNQLPEKYQMIFGRPELSHGSSRFENERVVSIKALYEKLRGYKGQDLKVLDLGCAQGFFSFSLATMGATVTGIDFEKRNIEVCEEIKKSNSDLRVEFVCADIQDYAARVRQGEFDLILGLSVWHHVTHNYGLIKTQNLIHHLHNNVDFHIYELALCSEQLYWADSQPSHPVIHFPVEAFSTVVASTHTHLGKVKRPLYYSSSKFALTPKGISKIVKCEFSPHKLFSPGLEDPLTRKYITTEDSFIKVRVLDENLSGESQVLAQELKFYEQISDGSDLGMPKQIGRAHV
jgi:O-antigen chain-terminating methyltransferase